MLKLPVINNSNHPLPEYKTSGASGMDLRANNAEELIIQSLERVLIPTGLHIALPDGYEAQIRPRSGLALKQGLSIPNAPATIDSDYRGEIKVILVNLSKEAVTIAPGQRIAQMVIAKVEQVQWEPTAHLDATERNIGGFGHTGLG